MRQPCHPSLLSDSADNRQFIEISIAGVRVQALLDSGAQRSLIDESLLTDLNITYSTRIRPSVVSADNSPIKILGSVELPIYFNGSIVFPACLVGRFLPTPFILGIEFWNTFRPTDVLSKALEHDISGKLFVRSSS